MKKFLFILLVILTIISTSLSIYIYFPSVKYEVDNLILNLKSSPSSENKDGDIIDNILEDTPNIMIANVPKINQHPQLPTGCEVTSLAMLLNWNNINVSKEQLAREIPKAPVPVNKKGPDPNKFFIGDPFSKSSYGVYHGPIVNLLNAHTNNTALDLTGSSFTQMLKQIDKGVPVIAWVTQYMKTPYESENWKDGNKNISWLAPEHAVVIVGYDDKHIIYNDPIDGKEHRYDKYSFKSIWETMGRQAVSIHG